jgi:hypothetical protein
MDKDEINLETYDALVGAIYDAASDTSQWNHFLAQLARAFNSHGAAIRLVDTQSFCPSFSLTHGYDEGYTQEYCDYYYQTDVTVPLLTNAPEGAVFCRSDNISNKNYINSAFYQDFTRKWDTYDLLGSNFVQQRENIAYIAAKTGICLAMGTNTSCRC